MFVQVLKRAAVQADAGVANAQLLQLESLCGSLDCFIEARKRLSASARTAPAAAKVPATAAGKVPKKLDDDASAPSAKRPRVAPETARSATASSAPLPESNQRPSAAASDSTGSEELTLHVKHAFEIRELSLRKL
jgi:hypothetical protein